MTPSDSDDTQYLAGNGGFLNMPTDIQSWILESRNAAVDFSEFFKEGGSIEAREGTKLPAYSPEDPPKIYVNKAQWESSREPMAPEWPQRHLFGTLVHEIGHHRFNTGNIPFMGTTAEEYVQYRSGLEAQAIFNAYPIFQDLENHPAFSPPPFESIGYLNQIELGAMYGQWRRGEISDQSVIDQIASKIADRPYTLARPVQDMDHDGVVTHRDNYLQDFEQYVAPRLGRQPSITSALDPVLERMDQALANNDDAALDAAIDTYMRTPQGHQFQREIDRYDRLFAAEDRQAELEAQLFEQQRQLAEQQAQQVQRGPVLSL